jgi:leucyl-tRNA synthetase
VKSYDHKEIEKKWQDFWRESATYTTKETAGSQVKKFFILDMFPYPSGEGLHVGHPKGYIATDAISRMKRMQGYSVLHPMGFDAFGLPAENYAIKTKTNPRIAVEKNVARYKKQLEILGFDYDWSREINTTDPEYYRWTQWIFLKLYEKGLAFESHEPINWCPSCKTGLANEDVEDGRCERCGTLVEKKPLRQWVLRITDYAERLLNDLETSNLDWPKSIVELQKNWIGKSEGALVKFAINDADAITVFTTRIDTIYSGTFVILAPEHPYIEKYRSSITNIAEVETYISQVKNKTDIERTDKNNKTGVELKGLTVINPATKEKLAVWVSDFVLGAYGTGAVFADAHDKRDFDMAKAYNIPLKISLKPSSNLDGEILKQIQNLETCYEGEGTLINSEEFDGLTSAEARPKIIDKLAKEGLADRKINYKLRDWVFSRQRYWGEPIPLIHCEKCGVVPVPEKDLPVTLPAVEHYEPTGTGESPLANISDWVNVPCPKCGASGKRETNTMPQWAGSSWYHLRYMDPKNSEALVSKSREKFWSPVDLYVGGAEHATRHLIYARFWHKFLYDIGVVSETEPFKKLQHVGLIMAEDGRKMSKRFNNVVNPDEIVAVYGADTLRLYEMFMGPFDQAISWSTKNMIGSRRFLERVWKLRESISTDAGFVDTPATLNILHKTIDKVSRDISDMHFNTAISALMILMNEIDAAAGISQKTYETILKLIAPFAPHMTEELWTAELGHKESIHLSEWPVSDKNFLAEEDMTIVVQVNGKVRGEVVAKKDEEQAEIEKKATEMPEIRKWLEGKKTKKIIFVKGKLINIVLE